MKRKLSETTLKKYVSNTNLSTNLRKYYSKQLEALQSGDVDYQKYIKKYYSTSKYLRKGRVKLGKIGVQEALSYEDFKMTKALGVSSKQLLKETFGILDYNKAEKLQAALAEQGFKITIEQAQTRSLTDAQWKTISEYYRELTTTGGLTSTQAADVISQTYFGS